jgi:hypothetical protein
MSYLAPHFDPDVFVSYSHGDPQGGRAPLRDWTQDLVRRLNDGLHALETEFDDLALFIDSKIDPTADLSDDLKGKAGACGVLMIVMSKRYLKSRWCKDELAWFGGQIQKRAGSGGRVFVIRAQETDTTQWPEFLRDSRGYAMTGFSFYDPENGEPWGFQLREPGDDYFKELTRLRIWLVKRLRELRSLTPPPPPPPPPSGSFGPDGGPPPPRPGIPWAASQLAGQRYIYLHAPPDSEPKRAEIIRALQRDHIISLMAETDGGKDLAVWQREARDRIEIAKRCEALFLLRVDDGERFVGDLLDIGVDERERIADARGAPMPCAVLDTTGKPLPINLAQFGIEHFDLKANWHSNFREWLYTKHRRQAAQ